METTKVLCDWCKQDLTSSGNSIDWSLRIINRRIPYRGTFVTDMYICACIMDEDCNPKDLDFCGIVCMKKYMEEKMFKAQRINEK